MNQQEKHSGQCSACIGPGVIPVTDSSWQVYILECADGSLYTGIATNLSRRLQQHNGELSGGPKYTRGRRPVTLRWSDTAADRSAALQREAAIKKLSRQEKQRLIA
ncbi:MAG: GIY-YIG nuclease family protein [Proteobacteria bacterium]|nr:GIY-YIG nuclease family protein [Pseudomonadota bacterium]